MKKLIYDCRDSVRFIKKRYPYIPKWIIRRILYAEELYMHSIGIIDYKPELDLWK